MTKLVNEIKQGLGSMLSDFYLVMKDDLEIDRTEYRMHFTRLADMLFEIDRCEDLNQLEALYGRGLTVLPDIIGVSFQGYVYELVKRLDAKEAV
jgi:hypothetical protein